MKKQFTSLAYLGAFGGMLIISSAFVLENDDDGKLEDFRAKVSCSESGVHDKSSNGTQTAYTMSAHDQTSPGTCASCHGGGVATPVVTVTSVPAFGAGNTYVPGTVYTITYQQSGYPFFGLDLEINDGNTTTSMTAGSLVAGTNTRFTANPFNQGFPSNISHAAKISSTSSATFTWHSPNVGVTAYLFSNVMGVNGNGNDTGDKQVFYNVVLTPASAGMSDQSAASLQFRVSPNPAADELQLSYVLENEGQVSISLYDLSGKLTSNLLNEKQSIGEQLLPVSVSSLESGVYILKINANGIQSTQKVLVE